MIRYDWWIEVGTVTGLVKNYAITTHADVSKAQNSAITALKWCDLGAYGKIRTGLDWTRLNWTRLVNHGLDSISKTWTQLLQLLFSQLLFLFVQLTLSGSFLSIFSIIIYDYKCPS